MSLSVAKDMEDRDGKKFGSIKRLSSPLIWSESILDMVRVLQNSEAGDRVSSLLIVTQLGKFVDKTLKHMFSRLSRV